MNSWRIVGISALLVFGACQNTQLGGTETGALTGGALGAGLGAIIGHETGHTGGGVAIGSAVGALAGGLVGNQIDKQNDQLNRRDEQIALQDARIQENQRMIDELKRRGADVRRSERGVVVNLPDVLFEFDSHRLRSDAVRAVKEIATVVQDYPDRKISVEGHTDSVGTIKYNQKLSEARSRSVADELVAQGVSRRRLNTYGFGESDPISSNRTDIGRSRNRRVEVIILN